MEQISTIIVAPTRKKRLTLKQKQFAKKYIEKNGNATKAAIEAYNSSYDTAQVTASKNLDNPYIVQEINKLLEKSGMSDDQWIAANLKTSIESGIGVKATNKDSLVGLNMLLKLKNAYPGSKNTSLKINLRGNLPQSSVDEVIKTLKTTQSKTNELIEDIS